MDDIQLMVFLYKLTIQSLPNSAHIRIDNADVIIITAISFAKKDGEVNNRILAIIIRENEWAK